MEDGKVKFHFEAPKPTLEKAVTTAANFGTEIALQEQAQKVVNNDVEYAVGLFWQPLQDVDDPISEIRETINIDPDTDLYCLYYGNSPQYGIGSSKKGLFEGQAVGAIAVLESLKEYSSFLAVFEVPEGFWLLAVRNDLILPQEDMLYTDEEEAKKAFASLSELPDWEYKVAPQSWLIDDSQQVDLSVLLKKVHQVHLQKLSSARGTKILISLALLIMGVIGLIGFFIYSAIKEVREEEKIMKPLPPKPEIRTIEPEKKQVKPWEKLVAVEPFLNRCQEYSFQLKSMVIPGWSLNNIVCTPQEMTTGWTKTGGKGSRLAWVLAAVREYDFTKVQVELDASGTSATAKIPFGDLPTDVSLPTLSYEVLYRDMLDISQATGQSITMSQGTVTVSANANPSQNKGPITPSQGEVYTYLNFGFSTPFVPLTWVGFFDKFSAIELSEIEYDPKSLTWKYKGRIYAQ